MVLVETRSWTPQLSLKTPSLSSYEPKHSYNYQTQCSRSCSTNTFVIDSVSEFERIFTCHMSCVTCPVSHISCHVSHATLIFFQTKW